MGASAFGYQSGSADAGLIELSAPEVATVVAISAHLFVLKSQGPFNSRTYFPNW